MRRGLTTHITRTLQLLDCIDLIANSLKLKCLSKNDKLNKNLNISGKLNQHFLAIKRNIHKGKPLLKILVFISTFPNQVEQSPNLIVQIKLN